MHSASFDDDDDNYYSRKPTEPTGETEDDKLIKDDEQGGIYGALVHKSRNYHASGGDEARKMPPTDLCQKFNLLLLITPAICKHRYMCSQY